MRFTAAVGRKGGDAGVRLALDHSCVEVCIGTGEVIYGRVLPSFLGMLLCCGRGLRAGWTAAHLSPSSVPPVCPRLPVHTPYAPFSPSHPTPSHSADAEHAHLPRPGARGRHRCRHLFPRVWRHCPRAPLLQLRDGQRLGAPLGSRGHQPQGGSQDRPQPQASGCAGGGGSGSRGGQPWQQRRGVAGSQGSRRGSAAGAGWGR